MTMPRPQFSLRSLFILTAIVAVGCLVGPPIAKQAPRIPGRISNETSRAWQRLARSYRKWREPAPSSAPVPTE
jgi:predicted PurR-regulated permease PerM